MKPSVVVFHTLGRRQLQSARRWLQKGCRVLYGTADASIPVEEFEKLPPPRGIWPSSMIDLVEAIFRLRIENSVHLAWAKRLYASEDIRLAFLRSIMDRLLQFYYLMDQIGKAVPDPSSRIFLAKGRFELKPPWDPFVFEFLHLVRSGQLATEEVEKIPADLRDVMQRVQVSRESGLKLLLLDLIVPIVFLLGRLQVCRQEREPVHLVVRTYPSDWGESRSAEHIRLRTVDFVVDGISFHAGNTVFWAEPGVPEARIRGFEARGYRVIAISDLHFDLTFIRHTGLPSLRDYLIHRIRAGTGGSFEGLVCRELFRTFVRTRAFGMRFKPRFFLLYNDLSVSSVGRTIVLRSTGCKSVFYEHSSNSLIEGVEPDLAYLLFDAVATWGQAMTGYFQRPPGNFGECWEVGCIWAEHVRVVREDEGLLKEYKTQIEHQVGRPLPEQARTISIFDTTINPVLFTQEDLSLFLADVAWLAETFPDVLIFYKTKWSIEFLTEQFGEEFQKRFQRLYEIPNVIVIPNYFETAAIIGLADLTISACFSTTAIESIGCGTRALYYDVSDRCPPDNIWGAFWHRIPELVCRSREELKDRIYKLMYETSDEEYRDYLHLNFKHMDGFFDGRAITRLRRKLADGMDARLAAEQDYGR